MFDWDAVPDDIANYVAVEPLSSEDELHEERESPEKLGTARNGRYDSYLRRCLSMSLWEKLKRWNFRCMNFRCMICLSETKVISSKVMKIWSDEDTFQLFPIQAMSSKEPSYAELHSFHLSAWGTPGTRSLSATSSMVLHCHLPRAHPRWFRWFPSRRTSLLQSSRQFVGWCRKSVYARTWTEGMTWMDLADGDGNPCPSKELQSTAILLRFLSLAGFFRVKSCISVASRTGLYFEPSSLAS